MADPEEPTRVPSTGPFVRAAFLCETVMREQDGRTSAIRMMDLFTFVMQGPNPPATMPEGAQIGAQLLVVLVPGEARGRHNMRFELVRPTTLRDDPRHLSVTMPDSENETVTIHDQFVTDLRDEGLHWIDVFFNDQMLTRVPFRVVYNPVIQP